MGHLMFYVAVVAACLLWSAACVAGAARVERAWLRRLLVAAALIAPTLALAPWVGLTAYLAFAVKLRVNWFAPTLTALIAAVVGGIWIVRGGLARRAPDTALAAAAWPVVALAAMFLLAKAVAFGTLLFIDNAVAAEGRALRVEAAQIMATALPPAPEPERNAAPLYQRAFAALPATETIRDPESPWANPETVDVAPREVSALLERHAAALDVLRRATDRPGCHFDRDWSRPSVFMLLPEFSSMRQAARLLTLAARKAAADGDGTAALADVVRLHRLGMHAGDEPTLPSGLLGQSIDAAAVATLVDVLPRLGKEDLPLLDTDSLRDFVATPIRCPRAFLGDEAFGLAMLAELADGERNTAIQEALRELSDEPIGSPVAGPFSLMYRCFLLPADIAGFRTIMRRYQAIVGSMLDPSPTPYEKIMSETEAIDDELRLRRWGIVSSLLASAWSPLLTSQCKGQAMHDAAGVLVAATRARLAGGSLPTSLVPDVLPELPRDPFTADKPLLAKRTDSGWIVYSVGPDGEDDGGPPPPDVERSPEDDDIGLCLAVPAADT